MKKLIINPVVIVICVFIFQSCAKSPFYSAAIYLGGQNSSLPGQSDSYTNAFGAQGGVALNVFDNLNIPISARVETNVSMQGARYEDDWGEGPVEGLTRLTYLNFPLVARYQLDNGFYGEAGLQPGVLLGAKDKVGGESWDYKEWVNTFDFGIPITVGYEFKNNIGVSIRGIPGVTNVNSGEDVSKDRNFVVAVRGTYTLKLKNK